MLSKKAELHDAIVEDACSVLSSRKEERSDDTRAALQMGLSLLCGETVKNNNLHSTLSKSLNINRRHLAMCTSHWMKVLCDESVRWTSVKRQKRSDAISDGHWKLASDFWASPGISRPMGIKRDITRECIGPKNYHEHEKQILEKTHRLKASVYYHAVFFTSVFPNLTICLYVGSTVVYLLRCKYQVRLVNRRLLPSFVTS